MISSFQTPRVFLNSMFLETFPNLNHSTVPQFYRWNPSSYSPRFPPKPDIPSSHQSSLEPHLSLFPPASDLQAPLESLKLSLCSLVPDDLAFLSQSFHAPALKKLHLSDDRVSEGLLEPLRLLLEKTSASLLYLNLRYCHIADSDLEVLLPTLLRCSRLRFLGLYRNPLSTAALKDLLQKTLELPDLKLVVYPYPMDCYKRPQRENNGDYGTNEDCERDEGLFAVAKAEFSEILANSGRTDLVWTDSPKEHTALDYFSL